MTKRHAPPGRKSNSWKVLVKPSGPHQRASTCGSLNARKTRSRGASNTRLDTISRSARRAPIDAIPRAVLPRKGVQLHDGAGPALSGLHHEPARVEGVQRRPMADAEHHRV